MKLNKTQSRVVSLFVLGCAWCGICFAQTEQSITTYAAVETREYSAINGRKVRFSSLGNLVGLESPQGFEHLSGKRPREGYVLAYQDPATGSTRVIHNVFDRYSSILRSGVPDFLPVAFTGPADGTQFRIGASVSATAIVQTRDGLFRITRALSWTAGTGSVILNTTIQASTSIWLMSLKLISDIDLDTGGSYGVAQAKNDVDIVAGPGSREVQFFDVDCDPRGRINPCPPPPPLPLSFSELGILSQHLMRINASPSPTHIVLKLATDLSELTTPFPGTSMAVPIRNQDIQEILAWTWSPSQRIGPGGLTFTKRFDVQ